MLFWSLEIVLSFISFFSRLIRFKHFTSIHHFLHGLFSASFTVSSSELASWASHCSTILLKDAVLLAIHFWVSVSCFSVPRCQARNCWDSTKQLFSQDLSPRHLRSMSRCSMWDQQQSIIEFSCVSNENTFGPSKLLFCIVNIVVSELAKVSEVVQYGNRNVGKTTLTLIEHDDCENAGSFS